MRSIAFILFAFVLMVIAPSKLFATGANPTPVTVTQPDGSSLTIRQHGDEWFSWITTTDEFRVVKNNKGIYEYAILLKSAVVVASGVKASDVAKRGNSEIKFIKSLTPHIGVNENEIVQIRKSALAQTPLKNSSASNSYFPCSGNQNLLVILVNFKDSTTTYSKSNFEQLMNMPNYNDSGSFNDYFREVSNASNTLNITSTITDWLTVNKSGAYYGEDDKDKKDVNVGELVLSAIQKAHDSGVNFDSFDNNKDGIVESIMIVHKGNGQEASTLTKDIWSHHHKLSSKGISQATRTIGGKIFDSYFIVPECRAKGSSISNIGVICHEFGHALGMSDYYNTLNSVGYTGTGTWDLMANGDSNVNGAIPAHPNPYEKIKMGWATETALTTQGTYTLSPILTGQTVYRINSPNASEYFLLENRVKSNFDFGISGEGMLLYHVDDEIIITKAPSYVNAGFPQGLVIMPAYGGVNSANCPFPGTYNITSVSDFTTPNTQTWDRLFSGINIGNISLNNQQISFDLNYYRNYQFEQPVITQHAFNNATVSLQWNPVIDENFSVYDAFAGTQNGVTTVPSIANWTMVDLDKCITYPLKNKSTNYPIINKYIGSFFVGASHDTTSLYPYIGNHYLGCISTNPNPKTNASWVANNDWIISPQIEITNTTWWSFMARSLTTQYGMERINVYISETDNNITSFKKLNTGNYMEVPGSWTLYKYDQSAYIGKKIYFAIQCVSNDALMLMIDAIRITETEPTSESFLKSASTSTGNNLWGKSDDDGVVTPSGLSPQLKSTSSIASDIIYNIYRNNQLIASQKGMTNTSFFESLSCSSYDYYVEAVRTSPSSTSQSAVVTIECYQTNVDRKEIDKPTFYVDEANQHIKIEIPNLLTTVTWQLMNISGNVISNGQAANSFVSIPVGSIPVGIYLLQLNFNNQRLTYKHRKM